MVVALLLGTFLLCLCLFYNPKWLFLTLSTISFGYYFGIPGDNLLIFIIFLLGILLLIIEVYVPDFGIIGTVGLLVLGIALYMHLGDFGDVVLNLLYMLVVGVITFVVPLNLGKNLAIGKGFVLETSFEKEKGYSSHRDFSYLNGKKGIAVTTLRPVGRASIDNEYYEVISSEGMILSGANIYVAKVEGSKIFVRKD
ncbi:NfeD family protein [Aerococcaceae bacterium WGS1372]